MMVRRKNVPWQIVEDQVVIIAPKQQTAHKLNEVASFIWKQTIGDGTHVDHVVDQLVDHFDVEQSRAEEDAKAFLQELIERDLVQVVDAKA